MGDQDKDITDLIAWCRDLRGLTPATVRARQWVLNRLAVCVDRPLAELAIGHVQFWEQTVVAGLAPQSRRAYTQHVRSFYRWMVTTGRTAEDPTVMLTRPKVPKPLPHPIPERDLARALAAAGPKIAAMMTLMADAGLRCQEVAGLLWSDIEVVDGAAWLTVRNGKGARDRIVPVGQNVLRALRRHGTRARGPIFLGPRQPADSGQLGVTVGEHAPAAVRPIDDGAQATRPIRHTRVRSLAYARRCGAVRLGIAGHSAALPQAGPVAFGAARCGARRFECLRDCWRHSPNVTTATCATTIRPADV